jgi:hypothetical protein
MARNCVPFHSYLNESGVGCSRSSHRPNGFSMELAACGHLGLVWARLGSARRLPSTTGIGFKLIGACGSDSEAQALPPNRNAEEITVFPFFLVIYFLLAL